MGSIGEPFDIGAAPVVGTTGPDYAEDIDDILDEVIDRLETPVPIGSLAAAQTGETLDMNAQGIVNAGYYQLYDGAGVPVAPPFNAFQAYNGEVYWVSPAGVVQITVNGQLNASAIGGIVGNYGGADPAKVYFDGSTETYKFYDDLSLTQWAVVECRQLDLIDEASARVVHVKPSASIAATWTLTLPVNDPASGVSLPTVDNSGVMSYAETTAVTNGPLFNADVTLQNASKIKHGTRTVAIGGTSYGWTNPVGTSAAQTGGYVQVTALDGGAAWVDYTLPVQQGWRVKVVRVYVHKADTTTTTAVVESRNRLTSGAGSLVTSDNSTSGTAGERIITVTLGTPHVMAVSETLRLIVEFGAVDDQVKMIEIDYDVV